MNTYHARGENSCGGEATVRVLEASIRFDGSAASSESVPGPAHLLAASLAACILKNVERFSGILSFDYSTAGVDVVLERQDRPPQIIRATYTLEVHSEIPTQKAQLLHKNIRKFGTITNTLARSCELEGEVWLVRPDGERLLADASAAGSPRAQSTK